ncbi:ABC transporter permease subunit [Candidatus Sumerlaeota bacterium]|nr:ABC transporter permease subunit [Candidatus Sumerlaeota bacterium]
MNNIIAIFRRELRGYFTTPVAYVFIATFLFLTGIFTFSLGGFYEARQASLRAFFDWHPWLYLFLVPAISMRLWSEERSSGTIELLLTLPITLMEAILGKFLAAWCFLGVALSLTFPMVLTVGYLGQPDWGVILASYMGSFLMAGAYLAIGCCISAATKNQVICFVLSVVICFLFLLASFPVVINFIEWAVGWAPPTVVDAILDSINAISFSSHFLSIERGVIEFRDVVFFLSLIAAWLYGCSVVLDVKKAD